MERRTFLAFPILGFLARTLWSRWGNHALEHNGPLSIRESAVTDQTVANALRLWYRQPAANWNEALPIGNGRLGAMVFGGVSSERIQLNEDTI